MAEGTSIPEQNHVFDIKSLICPICSTLVIEPIIASDGVMYCNNCIKQLVIHAKTASETAKVISPITRESIYKGAYKVNYTFKLLIGNELKKRIFELENMNIDLDRYIYYDIPHPGKLNFYCKTNNSPLALKELELGYYDINYIDDTRTSSLLWCCYNNMIDIALKLLDIDNLDINLVDKKGNNCLIVSCQKKLIPLISKILINTDININQSNSQCCNALLFCCYNTELEDMALKILEFDNVEINQIDNKGEHCLILAIYRKMERLARKLLEYPHININHRKENSYGYGVLDMAIMHKMEDIALRILENKKFKKINYINSVHQNELFDSIYYGLEKVSLKLLDVKKINYNLVDNDGDSVLMVACKHNFEELALKLLDKPDYNYNQINKQGNTALIFACSCNLSKVAVKLLKKPDINYWQIDNTEKSAFTLASENNMGEVLEIIDSLKKQ